jgi:peptide/nickel transport system ATP-binding protein
VSGGEIQRICIARALLLQPLLLLLDEPTSMLDISVQAQILHLLRDIRREHDLAYLFITHDRQLAQWLCDRTLYIERGRVQ